MNSIDLTVPTSWSELTQEQLDFLLRMITDVNAFNADRSFYAADEYSVFTTAQVATYCLFRWNGITVVSPYNDGWLIAHGGHEYVISPGDIVAAAAALDWIKDLPEVPVRLENINGANAVDAALDDDFSFDDWLACEALWQGYQAMKDNELLRQMAEILYRKPDIVLLDHEYLSIFYWWASLKTMCNRRYSNFFQSVAAGTAPEISQDILRRNMDAQIRALTKGDITKEERILSMPAHRALTELDALAREYEELNRKYSKK